MQNALGSPLLSLMQKRLAQTSNRTKISADSTSIRAKTGAKLTSNCIKIDANSTSYTGQTKIGLVPSIKHTKIGVVPNRTRGVNLVLYYTKIGVNPQVCIITKSSKITTRISHARPNRLRRVPTRRVFNNKVVQLAIAIKAV